jgi:transposase
MSINVAGIDCGSAEHFVAEPPDRDPTAVQSFKTFTSDLHRLADWLTACRVKSVAMEATGVYWIPLYEILEARGFDVVLVNARHVKNVPGRKSDVLDCEWLLRDLLESWDDGLRERPPGGDGGRGRSHSALAGDRGLDDSYQLQNVASPPEKAIRIRYGTWRPETICLATGNARMPLISKSTAFQSRLRSACLSLMTAIAFRAKLSGHGVYQ